MSWPTVPLDTVAEVVRGVTFSKADAERDPSPGLLPVLRAGNIAQTLNTASDLVYVDQRRVSDKQKLRPKDIVVCTSSGSAAVLGKSAMLNEEWHGSFGAFLATVRTDADHADPDFVGHYLRSPGFRMWASNSSGIGIKNIRASDFKELEIPLPPLAEQKRIAGILDQAAELCRLRTRALEKLNTLRQAIFNEMFGDPAVEIGRWDTFPLAEFASHRDDIKCGPFGTQLLQSEFVDAGVPLWGIKQVNKFFRLPTHEFITEEKFNSIRQYSIEPKDIVMTRKGTIGNCAVYPDTYPVGLMHSDLLRLRVDPDRHVPEFVADQLRFNRSFGHQLKLISGGAIMAGINVSRLKALHAIAPPLELQREYAERVRTVEKKANSYLKSREVLDALFASLQHRAFRGEL